MDPRAVFDAARLLQDADIHNPRKSDLERKRQVLLAASRVPLAIVVILIAQWFAMRDGDGRS